MFIFATVKILTAGVVELVDTLDLGSSAFGVRVRVSPPVLLKLHFLVKLFYRTIFAF